MNLRGFGRGLRGRFGGRGRGFGPAGPRGNCICVNPNCRNEVSHRRGVPCYQMSCPKCGSPMVRKDDNQQK